MLSAWLRAKFAGLLAWQATNSRFFLAALTLLSTAGLLTALDPNHAFHQYTQDIWSTEAGLPQSNVTAIVQTPDGYLWLGTEEGLARFDGLRFTTFDTRNTPALRSNRVSTLLVDSRKQLWIGTENGGLTLYAAGKFANFTTRQGLATDGILSLFEDHDGVIWIGTDGGGLNCYRHGAFGRCEKDLSTGAVFSIAGGPDGSLWVGTHDGLKRLQGRNTRLYTRQDGLPDDYIKAVYVDKSGSTWVGTNGGGVSRLINGQFVHYGTREGLASNSIWSIYQDNAGAIWVSTSDGGLSRILGDKINTYTEKDGLPFNKVLSFLEDREGDFWIGTGGAGLVRLKSGAFVSFTKRDGLSDDVVLPVFEDSHGAIWLGTNGGGLNRLKDGQITHYTTADGLLDNVIFSIAEDHEGSLWVATARGVNRLENTRFVAYTTSSGISSDIVSCLFVDRDGVIWAGSRGGLGRFDGKNFRKYTTEDGLSNNHVTSIYQDSQGTLWIGTYGGGLNRFNSVRFTVFSTANGLSSNSIRCLNGDPDGTLWIGTSGGGLDRLKDGRITAYTTRAGLFDDELYQVVSDHDGYLWMSSNKGIARISKRQLEDYASGRATTLTSTVYGLSDGLKNKECNGGFQPAGWTARDGRLLFPTMKGLAVVDPSRLRANHVLPPVVIEGTSVDGLDFNPSHAFRAKPGKGRLEFEFTALSLMAAEKIRFRYRLEGFDKDWVDAGSRRAAYYTNIAPGDYRFTVIASNNDGVWNTVGASLPFTLTPHFYQTPIFIALCLAVVTALSLAAYRIRINHLIANEKKLVRLVNERTQSLRLEVQAKERARAELAQAQQHLMELSRRSGMAEVATGVLHNVGNVLNSVNVGASVISDNIKNSRLANLTAAVKLLEEHTEDFSDFIQKDPKGQRLVPYLSKLASFLQGERHQLLTEVEALMTHVDHIKEIVSTQQDYAKMSALIEMVHLPKLVEDAYRMVEPNFKRNHVTFSRDFEDVPCVSAARHKVLEILINLLGNAQQAVVEHNGPKREVKVTVKGCGADRVQVLVKDSGVGLSAENLTRIFAHGFTTKRDGHGFGLHSGALAAREMRGSLRAESEGAGHGATFVLELPIADPNAEASVLAPAEASIA